MMRSRKPATSDAPETFEEPEGKDSNRKSMYLLVFFVFVLATTYVFLAKPSGHAKPPLYSCVTQESWSPERRKWCCLNEKVGCADPNKIAQPLPSEGSPGVTDLVPAVPVAVGNPEVGNVIKEHNDAVLKPIPVDDKKPKEAGLKPIPADKNLNIIFSTGCNMYQHWQAQVLLNSALAVGQKGKITRIVSGCETTEQAEGGMLSHPLGLANELVDLEELKKSNYPNYQLHITPEFEGALNFPWLNKPQGIQHYIENANPPVRESIIAIIDPDFVFVSPLRTGLSGDQVLHSFGKQRTDINTTVSRGHPVGQYYGIGSSWVEYAKDYCDPGTLCASIGHDDANSFFSVGPPYILHHDDIKELAPLYTEYMKKLGKAKGFDILSDMYAYAMAAANLGLKHTRVDNYMTSNVGSYGEAWDWVDLDDWDPCENRDAAWFPPSTLGGHKAPTFLHYCQTYRDDDDAWMFHKGHVPPNLLECHLPLIKHPPHDYLSTASTKSVEEKRKRWTVCALTNRVNQAVIMYKQKYCDDPNLKYGFKLTQAGQNCARDEQGKTCWQLAVREAEVDE